MGLLADKKRAGSVDVRSLRAGRGGGRKLPAQVRHAAHRERAEREGAPAALQSDENTLLRRAPRTVVAAAGGLVAAAVYISINGLSSLREAEPVHIGAATLPILAAAGLVARWRLIWEWTLKACWGLLCLSTLVTLVFLLFHHDSGPGRRGGPPLSAIMWFFVPITALCATEICLLTSAATRRYLRLYCSGCCSYRVVGVDILFRKVLCRKCSQIWR